MQSHPTFERKGDDIQVRVPVKLTDAVLGAKIRVPNIEDEKLSINIPPGTQVDQKFRLKGKGFPILKSSERGNLIVEIKVQVPKKLTSEQLDFFEKLRDLKM